jgi:hypothetical protein
MRTATDLVVTCSASGCQRNTEICESPSCYVSETQLHYKWRRVDAAERNDKKLQWNIDHKKIKVDTKCDRTEKVISALMRITK